MPSYKDIVERWKRKNYNQPEKSNDVEKVLEAYLSYDSYIRKSNGGSHNIIVKHESLIDEYYCNYKGEFTIPVHKNKVLPIYYKQLLKILDFIKEYENEKRS